jgi:hypothetical protein
LYLFLLHPSDLKINFNLLEYFGEQLAANMQNSLLMLLYHEPVEYEGCN